MQNTILCATIGRVQQQRSRSRKKEPIETRIFISHRIDVEIYVEISDIRLVFFHQEIAEFKSDSSSPVT